jgi:hypothetical protein
MDHAFWSIKHYTKPGGALRLYWRLNVQFMCSGYTQAMPGLTFAIPHAGRRRLILPAIIAGLIGLLGLGGCVAVNVQPAIGAQVADVLRGLIGDQAVAELETVVYRVQDSAQQWVYRLGGSKAAAPWAATPVAASPAGPTPAAARPTAWPPATPNAHVTIVPGSALTPAGPPPAPTRAATATAIASPVWVPTPLAALGTLPGEGLWSVYLRDASGRTVAYRTFVQPDPQRPYAVVAIVAFNLDLVRLHYVLGSLEPRSPIALDRPGTIPANDQQPGVLLAAFNGGFKAREGHFGAMVNGVIVLPPRADLGTVALYTDGRVRIGAWGTDIIPSPDIVDWRQNGPLLIHQGQINPHTAEIAPWDWGYSLDGASVVWRSGLGLSPDNRILYYEAGPHLTTSALALAMATTGVPEAMQLDINNFWVHFDAIQAVGTELQPTPLLDTMQSGTGRYLKAYPRDFFYITAMGR